MTLRDAARRIRSFGRSLTPQIDLALMETARQAFSEAVKLSSGTRTLKQLAADDHPYALRHGPAGKGVGDPALINQQTGRFAAGWELKKTPGGYAVMNQTPEASFLQPHPVGSMIARPIEQRIYERVYPDLQRRINDAINRSKP